MFDECPDCYTEDVWGALAGCVCNNYEGVREVSNFDSNTTKYTVGKDGALTPMATKIEIENPMTANTNDLDNSLYMDVPEEIREAAKKAGLGVENISDLILSIKKDNRQHELSKTKASQDQAIRNIRENRKNTRVSHEQMFRTQANTIAHNEASLALQQEHEFRMQKLRNHDNVNKRAAKIKIAQIKGQVKVKNEHGVSVGQGRWLAARTLSKSVGWVAGMGSLAYIAYQISVAL